MDPDGHVAWWGVGAGVGAAFEVGTYLWRNRKKDIHGRGGGRAALVGEQQDCMAKLCIEV